MALNPADKTNFNTLLAAAKAGDLSLVECKDAETGEYRAVICAIGHDDKTGEYNITPFGHLATGNPYEQYIDPTTAKEIDDAADEKGKEDQAQHGEGVREGEG